MRRILCALLALSMTLPFAACGGESTDKQADAPTTQASTSVQTTSLLQTTQSTTLQTAPSTGAVTAVMTTAPTMSTTASTTAVETTTTTTTTTAVHEDDVAGDFFVSDGEGTRWVEDADVASADALWVTDEETSMQSPVLRITLTEDGIAKYAAATEANTGKLIYLWLGDILLATPVINGTVADGVIDIPFSGWDDESMREIEQIAQAIMA